MTLTATSTVSRDGLAKQALSTADLERLKNAFAEDGFVVIKDVVSRERLAELHRRIQAEFERARETGTLFSGGGTVSGHLNCFPGADSRFVYETLQERGVIDLVRAIAPQSVREPNVGCNFNMPNSVIQHYHMDRTFTNEFMIVNIAVVDTNLVNGAIELAPKTHQKFYKFWRWALERPYRNSVRVEMSAGDVLVRVSNLWHRGMPNRSAVPRPMLAYTWEDGGSNLADPFQSEGGKITFRPNWFRPSRLGRLRERTFVAAPWTYSAYRFVDSVFSNKSY
ncbi:MAG TPA: phytanoyl-CoA dioxygenase family protein [Chloroflexota bacterium]|nr:phytanoyl-CoA dioxygenase family protein [Chloroflexota bacterium]